MFPLLFKSREIYTVTQAHCVCLQKKPMHTEKQQTTPNKNIKQQRGRQNGQRWSEHTDDNKHLDIIWYG